MITTTVYIPRNEYKKRIEDSLFLRNAFHTTSGMIVFTDARDIAGFLADFRNWLRHTKTSRLKACEENTIEFKKISMQSSGEWADEFLAHKGIK